ncbi:uncharacterized protein LOC121733429 isoform X3 [Aricia agestis]|uniref:uncharacterized protein LOC121733429 isoform X3 n=1 Tax=Aricia agestis TaxID=91739 RepID=UPI001C207C05|nr:uncharacterized protein LOC121733429 isoform X3 [Aricia agestis]
MKVGDEYSSYEEFEEALNKYKKSVSNEYWIRDARTIANQKRRFPGTVDKINESLKYYYIRLACVKGGRPFKSKNDHSSRKCTTLKQDCGATIFLRLSPSQKTLKVVELNEKHNHETSKSYFDSLSQQRLKLPKTVNELAEECLKAGANKKIVLDHIQQQTGCKITLKDLINLIHSVPPTHLESPHKFDSSADDSPAFHEEIDGDKHFALSLVPTLKQMNDDQKLAAKMRILQTLQEVRKMNIHQNIMYVEDNMEDALKVEYLDEDNSDSSFS